VRLRRGVLSLQPQRQMAAREYADLAQLVEQLIRNEQVVGSSPIIGSFVKALSASVEGFLFVRAFHSQPMLMGKVHKHGHTMHPQFLHDVATVRAHRKLGQ
jgi:hypothetical protein